jgi:hypothetical protein
MSRGSAEVVQRWCTEQQRYRRGTEVLRCSQVVQQRCRAGTEQAQRCSRGAEVHRHRGDCSGGAAEVQRWC